MKHFKIYFFLCLSIVFTTSCSDDDSNSDGNEPETTTPDYFPNTVANYWKYDVANTDNETSEITFSNDSLYVTTQTATTFTLGVNDGLPANGTMSGFLSSGTLSYTEQKLTLNGALLLPPELSDVFDLDINLTDMMLYNTDAGNNTALSSNANTITQDFGGFPVTINYNISTKSLGFNDTLTLNNTDYSNVIGAELTLNISISTSIDVGGFPVNISILDPQDTLVSTYYFVDQIGMVKATSENSYEISASAIALIEAAGQTFPLPTSSATTNIENLSTYNLAE